MSEFQSLRTAELSTVIERFLLDLKLRNCSPRTIEHNACSLNQFKRWCSERSVLTPQNITDEVILAYRRYLFHAISEATGKSLHINSQASKLTIIRSFCRWLVKHEIIDRDPSLKLEIPQTQKRRIADVLTNSEIMSLLSQPDIKTPLGIRNRAILETLFSTAIRASELRNLEPSDIVIERKLVTIHQGKGGKDRVVPISTSALDWITKYRSDVRPRFHYDHSDHKLFLSHTGNPLSREMLALIVRRYMKSAGIEKRGACHLLRHSAATLMLENGADLRSLQAYLGHAKLDTTQLYTHMTLGRLKEVHEKTHPTGDQHQPKKPGDV